MHTRLRQRLSHIDPLWFDIALAVGLTMLVFLQLWLMSTARPEPFPGDVLRRPQSGPERPGWLGYALVAASFLPLIVRRKAPWIAFAISSVAAITFSVLIPAPAPTVLAPMIATYTLALHTRKRRTGLVAILVSGLVIAAGLFVFTPTVRWVAEVVGPLVLLAATALLGEAERNRREYVAEFERRALEAERTREEEARRRVDEERIRIAREVHDIVAHSLSIVTVQAGAAAALLDDSPERARESIENVRATGKQALAELRSMLDVLRTADSEAPLAPAADISNVGELVERVREAGIEIELDVHGDLVSVPAYASVSAYRIVQEALTNVVRHAGARRALVSIRVEARELSLLVEDDGPNTTPVELNPTAGHGIRGMRERVSALGGEFDFGPGENGGARVSARIPLARSTA